MSKPVEIGQRQGLRPSVHVEAFLLSSLFPSRRRLPLGFRSFSFLFISLLPPNDLVFASFSLTKHARTCVRYARNVVLCSVCQQRFESIGRGQRPPVPNGRVRNKDRRGSKDIRSILHGYGRSSRGMVGRICLTPQRIDGRSSREPEALLRPLQAMQSATRRSSWFGFGSHHPVQ